MRRGGLDEVIGRNIRLARREQGMTQAKLGEQLGLWLERPWPHQVVSVAERGVRAFTATEVLALALVLDRQASWFFLAHDGRSAAIEMPAGVSVAADDLPRHVLLDSGEPMRDPAFRERLRWLLSEIDKDQAAVVRRAAAVRLVVESAGYALDDIRVTESPAEMNERHIREVERGGWTTSQFSPRAEAER